MIFKFFDRFLRGDTAESYLINSYNRMIDDLNTGLSRLRLSENFESYTTSVTINSGAELAIPHNLGVIPNGFIVLRQEGNGNIVDGDTAWTESVVYLQNVGAASATIKVIFLR